jgi:hypothetical protein
MHDVHQLALGVHHVVDRLVGRRRFVNHVDVLTTFDRIFNLSLHLRSLRQLG